MSLSKPLPQRRNVRSCKTAILNGCNGLLALFQNNLVVLHLHMNVSTCPNSVQLNGSFTVTGVRCMLKGKD